MFLPQGYPDTVQVAGVTVRMRTSFRAQLLAETLSTRLEGVGDTAVLGALFLAWYDVNQTGTTPEVVTTHPKEAVAVATAWHNSAYEAFSYGLWRKQGGSGTNSRPRFDWEQDEALIVCDFARLYSIDLNTVQGLHWYQFVALLMGAMRTEGSLLQQAISARSPLPAGASKYERKAHAAAYRAWELTPSVAEQNRALVERF